jgi:uncharacterized membrane protein YccF (DUF307 family)
MQGSVILTRILQVLGAIFLIIFFFLGGLWSELPWLFGTFTALFLILGIARIYLQVKEYMLANKGK